MDLDNDGALDLFLDCHAHGSAVVALNDGHGVFKLVANTSGSWPSSELHEMFDVNGDGKVDLSATYVDGGAQWWINNSTAGHVNFVPTNVTRDTNTARDQVLFDFNGDGNVDWFRSAEPGLVVDFGDGMGGFAEASLSFPVARKNNNSNDNADFLPGDFNDDGHIDLLVLTGGNYDGTPGRTMLWLNNGNQTFTDMTAESGIPINGTVAKGVGDFDQDGDLDFVATENLTMPPVIFMNDGTGTFSKNSRAITGVASSRLEYASWGTAVTTDFDNDGVVDIIMNGKYYLKLLRGTGHGTFVYINDAWKIRDIAASAVDDGLCFGDIDGDGALDIIGYDQIYPSRSLNVYHNELPPRSWLNVRLRGHPGNAGAAGATIRIYVAGSSSELLWYEQVAQYNSQVATSYYGFDVTERHYGLGSRSVVDVVVVFPSRTTKRLNGVRANTTVEVLEGEARLA